MLDPLAVAVPTCMAKCWCCWTGSPGWGSGTRGEPYSFVGSDPCRGPNVPGTAGLWGTGRGAGGSNETDCEPQKNSRAAAGARKTRLEEPHEQMGFLEVYMKNLWSLPYKVTHSCPAKATLSHPIHTFLSSRLQYMHLSPNYTGASKKTGGGSDSL